MSAFLGDIPIAVASFYDRLLLEREKPYLAYNLFGQVRNIPAGNGAVIKFRKYGVLAVNVTALTEGETPVGATASVTDITATALWYGDYMTYSDKVVIESPDPILTELTEVLADQAGRSANAIIRTVLVAGTNVMFVDHDGSANTETAHVGTDDVISSGVLDDAIADLRGSNAQYITDFVNPDAGYATSPLAPCFVGIVHPNVVPSLRAITNFVPVEKYANKGSIMPNEVGAYDSVRFIMSTEASVVEDSGVGSAFDVYQTVIFAKNAYGTTSVQGNAMKMIVKPLGSSGSSDPLNQRGTIGWKANIVAKILNQNWMIRIESIA